MAHRTFLFIFGLLFVNMLFSQENGIRFTNERLGKERTIKENNRIRIKTVEGRKISGAVKFISNKCLFFVKDKGDGIFTITQYDNYSKGLLKKNEYQLKYSFKQTDLNQAKECN